MVNSDSWLVWPCNHRHTETYMTTTAEHCSATFNSALHIVTNELCHDLIILSLPARFYVSQGSSCCFKPIAVLHLTVDGHWWTYSWKLGGNIKTPEASRSRCQRASRRVRCGEGVFTSSLGVWPAEGAVHLPRKFLIFFQLKWRAFVHPEKHFCSDI